MIDWVETCAEPTETIGKRFWTDQLEGYPEVAQISNVWLATGLIDAVRLSLCGLNRLVTKRNQDAS
jgi:hypothetical protein